MDQPYFIVAARPGGMWGPRAGAGGSSGSILITICTADCDGRGRVSRSGYVIAFAVAALGLPAVAAGVVDDKVVRNPVIALVLLLIWEALLGIGAAIWKMASP